MKLLVINEFGQGKIVTAQAIPNIGVSVDVFNTKPYLKVTGVLMWPSKQTLDKLNASSFEIEAVITCGSV